MKSRSFHIIKVTRFILGSLAALGVVAFSSSAQTPMNAKAILNADQPGVVVSPEIYGHFAEHLGRCVYEGIWVGPDSDIPNIRGIRTDVLEALRAIDIPVLRWPGGCFADEYHWRDGIGPRDERPAMINTHWGAVVENNHFGTHEFMDLVELLGCEAYVNGNVGSGTVQEMMEWVEYMTSDADSPMANLRRVNGRDKPWRVKFFGVGNESWGCGGNMRPEYYADLYRRYNTFVKNYDRQNPVLRIACGSNGTDFNWTRVLMERVPVRMMDGLSLHWYTLPTGEWHKKGSSLEFDEDHWFSTLRNTMRMDDLITRHSEIMDEYDPDKRVGMIVDEWGTWYDVEPGTNPGFLYQQNTLRDAIVAGLNLHIFQKHADRVTMANIAQTINVLQAMILTDKERMLRTPSYWVFEMFKGHQGGAVLPVTVEAANYEHGGEQILSVSASATRDTESGKVMFSFVNTNPWQSVDLSCEVSGGAPSQVSGRILTAEMMNAHNTFDAPEDVMPGDFDGASIDGSTLHVSLPAKSVVVLSWW